jgi:uncharacterized damage-inducible protein DinB
MEIPTKTELVQRLKESYQEVINWVNSQPESNFNQDLVPGKWTIAGHIYHLLKTNQAIYKGLNMPKLGLRTMFGKNKREERTYEDIVADYQTKVVIPKFKTLKAYEAAADRTFDRTELMNRFEESLTKFIKSIDSWNEKDMSIYVMPHPALGKCTIREFVIFAAFHNYHHLTALKENYV